MTYREARALRRLHAVVNRRAPHRSTRSDGWIGDAAHTARTSDHNPWVRDRRGVGVVRARDFTHDPAGGLDAGRLARELAGKLGRHPALGAGAYIIYNRQIISTARRAEGWRPYHGSNPHTAHVHVSVGTSRYDSTWPWWVLGAGPIANPYTQLRAALRKALDTYGPRVSTKRPAARALIAVFNRLLGSSRYPKN